MRTWTARLPAAVVAVAAIALLATAAHAHTELVAADPAPAAEVAPGAVTVSLTLRPLSEAPEPAVAVRDAAGADLTAGPAVMVDAETACVPTAPLPPGSYTVEYAVTAEDGHRVIDDYAFSVADGGTPVAPGACAPAAAPAVETPDAGGGAQAPATAPGPSTGPSTGPSAVPVIETASPRAASALGDGWLSLPVLAVVGAVLGLVVLGVVLVVRAR
ncbi:MAG: copper resistance protein CopC [Kineosporiaceae bacterium]